MLSATETRTYWYAHRMSGFPLAAMFGLALGFLFGVGCAAAVMYTIFLSGYRAALRDAANGGGSDRYRGQMRRLK